MRTQSLICCGLLALPFFGCAATPDDGLSPGETDDVAASGKDDSTKLQLGEYSLSPNFDAYSAITLGSSNVLTLSGSSDDTGKFRLTKSGSSRYLRLYSDPDGVDLLAKFSYVIYGTGATLTDTATQDVYTATLIADDPFSPASYCPGSAMTRAEAVALFAPGDLSVLLGTFRGAIRTRQCNDVTGCGAWTTTNNSGSESGLAVWGQDVYFEYDNSPGFACGPIDGSATVNCYSINAVFPTAPPNDGLVLGSGKITPSCVSFVRPTSSSPETQNAIFGRY